MQQHNTIEILRNSFARWVADAEAALAQPSMAAAARRSIMMHSPSGREHQRDAP